MNELGQGLHAYGFTEGTARWLVIFVASQLAIIAVGLVPGNRWRSRRNETVGPRRITGENE